MDLQSKAVKGRYWHGVGTEYGWNALKWGGSLCIPEPGAHAHDPGDYGLAVYLTDCETKAKTYAARIGGRRPALVTCRVALENAVIFDWRKGSALDAKHPTNEQTEFFEKLYGDPIHGMPEERRRVAENWRTRMIAAGYDGVVVLRRDETELAVYVPEKSITEIRLEIGL